MLVAASSGNREAFAAECLQAAANQPWNENTSSHALLASAVVGSLTESQMDLASKLPPAARGRVGLRLYAFAPPGSFPQVLTSKWVEDAAMEIVRNAQGLPVERATYESLLLSMDCLKRSGSDLALQRLLQAAVKTLPRVVDTEHW